jgi:hypothetical protein
MDTRNQNILNELLASILSGMKGIQLAEDRVSVTSVKFYTGDIKRKMC